MNENPLLGSDLQTLLVVCSTKAMGELLQSQVSYWKDAKMKTQYPA